MGTVGGPRHSARASLPGAGWQCPNCGALNVENGPCPVCRDDPSWRRPMPVAKVTGAQAARQTMAQVSQTPLLEPDEARVVSLNVQASIGSTYADVLLTAPLGEAYQGHGATLQEAVLSAIAALEEDEARPKCPTCGQHWPEDREYPTEEEA